MGRVSVIALTFFLCGCQTVVAPDGSRVLTRADGVVEIREAVVAQPEPVCLVRARFFRGMVGVPCSQIAQEVRP